MGWTASCKMTPLFFGWFAQYFIILFTNIPEMSAILEKLAKNTNNGRTTPLSFLRQIFLILEICPKLFFISYMNIKEKPGWQWAHCFALHYLLLLMHTSHALDFYWHYAMKYIEMTDRHSGLRHAYSWMKQQEAVPLSFALLGLIDHCSNYQCVAMSSCIHEEHFYIILLLM